MRSALIVGHRDGMSRSRLAVMVAGLLGTAVIATIALMQIEADLWLITAFVVVEAGLVLWGFWPQMHRWILKKSGLGFRRAVKMAEALGAAQRQASRPPERKFVETDIVEDDNTWLLSVTGFGEIRRYRAKLEVVGSNIPLTGASIGRVYTLRWQSNGNVDSELLPGHTDELPIARERIRLLMPGAAARYELFFANASHHRNSAHTKAWVYGRNDIMRTRPEIRLKVVLSADPPLPEPVEIPLRVDEGGVHRAD